MTANDNSQINKGGDDKGLFCPGCGSALLDASELANTASCKVCTWVGTYTDLAVYHFSHGHTSKEAILHGFFLEVRDLMSKQVALEFGKLLIKWGFVSLPTDTRHNARFAKTIARYIGGAAKAIATSIIETREIIEKEDHAATQTR